MSRSGSPRWSFVVASLIGALVVGTLSAGCTNDRSDRGAGGGAPTATSPARTGTPAPASTKVLVAFGLRRPEGELERFVERSATPGTSAFGRFLTIEELRDRFGASPATVRSARQTLSGLGIDAELDASGAVLQAEVSAGQAAKLGIDLVVQHHRDGSEVVVPARDPEVPDALAGPITEVAGLTATLPTSSDVDTEAGGSPANTTPDPGCGDPAQADAASVADANRWFGTAPLYEAGHDGDGVRVAILSVEQFDPAPVRAFATCRQSPTVIPDVDTVALTPTAPSGDEVTLDVIMAGWTAPGASLLVVRSDPYGSPVFPLLRVLGEGQEGGDQVDVLTTSITYCEAALPRPELALADHALLALAATGVTTLASSGDHGTAGCWPASDDALPAYPASSPWVTAVGGTQLVRGAGGTIATERAWSDEASGTSSGGGTSGYAASPAWQRTAGIDGKQRRYPDVSSLAAVDRVNSIPRCRAGGCTWVQIGGTSATAPTLAGDLAVALSASRAAGGAVRAGWLGPSIAAWATDADGPIADVTEGSTALGDRTCCGAERGFDLATGFGSMVGWDQIAADLARHRG